jgi:Na+-transporting NADH:ubiquinone oxidoreductase subunit A
MVPININKGYKLKVAGNPSRKIEELPKPAHVAALPEKIPFVKPRLTVAIGDEVNVGSVLFVDKRNPEFKFLSPGGGKVTQINFGPRRVIREIVITLDNEETFETFESVAENQIAHSDRQKLIELLLDGGLWPLVRQFPFRDIAKTVDPPPAIIVNLDDGEPFQTASDVYLSGQKDLWEYGIKVLRQLAQDKVYVSAHRDNSDVVEEYKEWISHVYTGRYPSDDPGVLLYHIRKSSSENTCWFIKGQDLLLLARLLKMGKYPVERVVAVAGSSAPEPRHVRSRLGAPLAHLTPSPPNPENVRFIAGGLFRGYHAQASSFLGYYETSLLLLPEGRREEVLGFVRPGFNKPSYSRAFLSYFNTSELPVDCNRQGGLRACIACGHCAEVCPVDIFPQLTYKAILADEVEEFLAHGLLDCVECGLCSFVCPSKIELTDILVSAKAAYYKEQTTG